MKAAAIQRLRKVDLAKDPRLGGITRKTLDVYLSMPDAPKPDHYKAYDILEVIEWVQKNSSHGITTKDPIKVLRAKKLGLECERIAHEINVERGNFVPRSEFGPTIARLWNELHSLLRQKFEFELPARCVGKNAIDIAQINIEALTLIDRRFKAGSPAEQVDQKKNNKDKTDTA